MNSSLFKAFCFIFSFLILTFSANAFPGEADTSYNPFILRSRRSAPFDIRLMRFAQQPDGKTIIVGNFSAFDGFAGTGVVRLDTDGNVDPTFNPPEIYNYEYFPSNRKKETLISGVAVQADGKIVIGGDFTKVNGVYRPSVARLNADGTPDTTFNAALSVNFTGSIYDVGVQPSGKILVGGSFCYSHPNLSRCGLVRLNSDGTPDTTFADIQGACRFRVASDGKIGYLSNFQSFMKLEADGALDSSFTPQSIAVTNLTEMFDVLFEDDGSVLVGGTFEFVNGIFRRFIVKFLPNGTVDTNFGPTFAGEIQGRVTSFLKLPDGKILMAGSFNRSLIRMTANGQIDTTFNYQGNDGQINFIVPIPNNRFIAGGQLFPYYGSFYNRLERIGVNGAVDNSYNVIPAAQPLVTAVAKQADGKIIVGGRFSDANGAQSKNIVRYNADGSRDLTFGPSLPSLTDAFQINDIKVLADGKIMIAPGSHLGLIRLNPNGSLDTTFVSPYPQTQNYTDLAPLPDGSLIVVGGVGLKKISPNASTFNLNNSFQQQSGAAGVLNKVAVQPDGKIIVGGEFTTVNSVPRSRIARFNADGTLDTSFDTAVGANATITSVKVQADGKILVGGTFTSLGGNTSVQGIGRLNPDGSVDSSFIQTANYSVHSIETQADGKIVIGGEFTRVGNVSRSGLARLNANGSLDTSFQVGSGTNGAVFELALQDDGKIVIGGDFTKYNNITKIGVARVLNNAAQPVRTRFDFDGDGRADIGVFRPSNFVWY
ncbi:MAG: hypothetical protein LUM44_21125, partial [Pyrinomonadaceae bacterium]|nr:hypothetical protein [Pyrinomonadaceae bacterium]